MTVPAPTLRHIAAQVAAIRQKSRNGDAIAIHTTGRWTGALEQQIGGERYCIYQCDSALAIRLALRDPIAAGTVKVVITPLAETDIEADVLLRLTKQKLFTTNPWQIVKSQFQARQVDPRLLPHDWMADLLIGAIPQSGYPPANSGFLDAETVWPLLLRQVGLEPPRPDLGDLLLWASDENAIAQYRQTSAAFQAAAADWLVEMAGAEAKLVLQCVLGCDRPDALPVGLVAQVLCHPAVEHRLDRAIGKIEERFLQGQSLNPSIMGRWGEAATQALQRSDLSSAQRQHLIQRSDDILADVGAADFADLSLTSRRGFALRLSQVAAAISAFLKQPALGTGDRFTDACTTVQAHILADEPTEKPRLARLKMAARLIRWLHQQQNTAAANRPDLEDAIQDYVAAGSFLDWARQRIREGDPQPELSQAYKQLFDRVTELREQQNHRFAQSLKNWLEVGSNRPGLRPIETLLDTLIAPLARQAPVLMVVLDGMSFAVCRELVADLSRHGEWSPLTPEGSPTALLSGLAVVPSLTTTSRTSLFCGQITLGTANTEAKGFAQHPALVKACRAQHPPRLFHKNALEDGKDGTLSADIRAVLEMPQHRVVGVVINAVDDLLDKGGQMNLRWQRDSIKILAALLDAAKFSNRWVILLSDHGHVIDAETTRVHGGVGARWRLPDSPPSPQELQVTGDRVLLPQSPSEPSPSMIAPWSEKLRYTAKKTGYHGGLTPQEMLIPIAVLTAPASKPPNGWTEAPLDTPSWWEEAAIAADFSLDLLGEPPSDPIDFGPLFSQSSAPTPPSDLDWVGQLLRSPLYQAQTQKLGRSTPNPDQTRVLLALFAQNQFQLKFTAIVRHFGVSPSQGWSLLTAVQRLLNIDGYSILTLKQSNLWQLDHLLLQQQFGLK